MAHEVVAAFITINERKHFAGEVVDVPAESVGWLLGNGYIAETEETAPEPEMVPATPAALALIARHELDPAAIHGTGAGGRITAPDVEAHLAAAEDPTDEDDDLEDDESEDDEGDDA